jgi:hypothetical protein
LFKATYVVYYSEWPLPKLYPVIPTSNQDGRQAKNRKRGDEIFKKSSPLKLLNEEENVDIQFSLHDVFME